jgi:hypothetical protein
MGGLTFPVLGALGCQIPEKQGEGTETGTRLVFGRIRYVTGFILRRKPPRGPLKESRASFYERVRPSLQSSDSKAALDGSGDAK